MRALWELRKVRGGAVGSMPAQPRRFCVGKQSIIDQWNPQYEVDINNSYRTCMY